MREEHNFHHKPIFIFSAGWRSGSTLLQRLLTASGDVLIWGEAGGGLNCFAEAAERYVQMLGPGDQFFRYGFGGNGLQQYEKFSSAGKTAIHKWIASMNPPTQVLQNSFRRLFETFYAGSAIELGYKRWGVKEVQSGIETALFLRQLYPEGKFVFLVRNPLACLLSIKRRNWMDKKGEKDPFEYFARHWKKLAGEFRQVTFGYHLRYEDLISDAEQLKRLEEYLNISRLPCDFISRSHVDWKAENTRKLSWIERARARMILSDEMAQHEYSF